MIGMTMVTANEVIIVVARTGPIAPPRFLSMLFRPSPTVVLSGGMDTEIMLTIGIIMAITPTKAKAESIVRSKTDDRFTMNIPNPSIMMTDPTRMTGFGPTLGMSLPMTGPATIMAKAAGARARPVEIVSRFRPYGWGSCA